MYDVIFKVGSYGNLFHAKVSSQELTMFSSVLMRAVPVRDKYDGRFEQLTDHDDNRLAITIVKSVAVLPPPALEPEPTNPDDLKI